MNTLVRFALRQRLLILILLAALMVAGGIAFSQLNIEAYPDPVPPMVEVVTQSAGLSAEEMERKVTIPVEVQMSGLKGLKAIRAISLFGELRVWDTEANNGVLIYLLLAEHAIEIIADRGLNAHVSQARWEVIIASLRESLRARQFEQGLEAAIDAVDGLLRLHFPLAAGAANPNELPDAVVLL